MTPEKVGEALDAATERLEAVDWIEETRKPPPNPREWADDPANRKTLVSEYLNRVRTATGHTVKKTDVWRLAGYNDRKTFEKWQRNAATPGNAHGRIVEVLSLSPQDFVRRLADETPRRSPRNRSNRS